MLKTPKTGKFVPGYLFKKIPPMPELDESVAAYSPGLLSILRKISKSTVQAKFTPALLHELVLRDMQSAGITRTGKKGVDAKPWKVWKTPLKHYVHFLNMDFEKYPIGKQQEAKNDGRTLNVLDIGVGSGEQWIDFLENHKIGFKGATLTKKAVLPALKDKVTATTIQNLQNKFKPNSFDVIVTHYGVHRQEQLALEAIIHLLKPGGEAILSGACNEMEEYLPQVLLSLELAKQNREYYKIIDQKIVRDGKNEAIYWALHVKKPLK